MKSEKSASDLQLLGIGSVSYTIYLVDSNKNRSTSLTLSEFEKPLGRDPMEFRTTLNPLNGNAEVTI